MRNARFLQGMTLGILFLASTKSALSKDMPCTGNACIDIRQNTGAMWKNVGKRTVTISWQPVVGLPGCGNWTSAKLDPGKSMNTNGVCNGIFKANY
jgi:hypothetical protein